MLLNPFLAQRVAEERIKDMLREAEQERLGRRVAVTRHRSSIVNRALLILSLMGAVIIIWQLA